MGGSKRTIEEYAIVFFEDASKDVIAVKKWYNKKLPGLGERFEKYLDKTIEKLITHPFAFSVSFNKIRKVQLDKFPYLVFYEVENNVVSVYGVIHAKRKPSYYKRSINKRSKSN